MNMSKRKLCVDRRGEPSPNTLDRNQAAKQHRRCFHAISELSLNTHDLNMQLTIIRCSELLSHTPMFPNGYFFAEGIDAAGNSIHIKIASGKICEKLKRKTVINICGATPFVENFETIDSKCRVGLIVKKTCRIEMSTSDNHPVNEKHIVNRIHYTQLEIVKKCHAQLTPQINIFIVVLEVKTDVLTHSRIIRVCDTSSVETTLQVSNSETCNVSPGDILYMIDVEVEMKGKSIVLSIRDNTSFARSFHRKADALHLTALFNSMLKNGTGDYAHLEKLSISPFDAPFLSIRKAKQIALDLINKNDTSALGIQYNFVISGYIRNIVFSKKEHIMYRSCAKCKKKIVTETIDNQCQNCHHVMEKIPWSWMFRAQIFDQTGFLDVIFFDNSGKFTLHTFTN
eukprot:GHVT01049512.1.p1 GENE.GHVT01049512.1~~GHVT01049512.1.p1  ORF type:complete len:398 (+),score=-13.19 GHVT01049512.1:134-1327(+)